MILQKIDSFIVVAHRFGLAIGQIFVVWFSLDHAGRAVSKSLDRPWLQIALFILFLGMGLFDITRIGKELNRDRLRKTTLWILVLSYLLLTYNFATRQIQLQDGLVDARLLAACIFISLSFVPIYVKEVAPAPPTGQ
jgi:hypothetical protein